MKITALATLLLLLAGCGAGGAPACWARVGAAVAVGAWAGVAEVARRRAQERETREH